RLRIVSVAIEISSCCARIWAWRARTSRTCCFSTARKARRYSATGQPAPNRRATSSSRASSTCGVTTSRRIEATQEAEEAWRDHVAEVANYILFPRAQSWYMGADIRPMFADSPAGGERIRTTSTAFHEQRFRDGVDGVISL